MTDHVLVWGVFQTYMDFARVGTRIWEVMSSRLACHAQENVVQGPGPCSLPLFHSPKCRQAGLQGAIDTMQCQSGQAGTLPWILEPVRNRFRTGESDHTVIRFCATMC